MAKLLSGTRIYGNATIDSNLIVGGNLTVTGNLVYLNVDNIVTQDALIYVADGNQFDFLDIGIVGNFTKNSFNQHGGIVRDASDSIWKFFANVESEPTTTVDFGSATYDSILAGNVLSTGNVVVGANITLNGRLFAGGSAGNGSDVLISTGSGVSWTALDKSSLEFDTSSLVLDNVWGNLILNNTSSVSFADADSTSIFHSNVEVNKNLTVDQRLTAQTANIAGLLISSANIQMNPGTGGGHFRIINGYGGGFQIDGEGPRMGLGTTANIFAYLHIWSVSNNNYINSTTRPLIIGFSPSSAGANILYMDPTRGNTVLNTNTASISSATGALVVAGGVGVVGNLNVGGNFTAGVVGSSNLQVTGGGSFSGTLTVSGGISGTISTTASSQPNITSTGTLTNLQTSSLGVGTPASGTSGEIRATNNITAYYSSDRTLKENIQDIPNALDKVLAIGGKTFDWTDAYIESHGGSDDYFLRKEDFGVIAQDVQQVFPPAVRQRPDGTLAVDYEKLCALAFQAIVELKTEIDVLKGK